MKLTNIASILIISAAAILSACGSDDPAPSPTPDPGTNPGGGGGETITGTTISLADPTIFRDDDGTYYLYGTSGDTGFDSGFLVYKSTDLKHWSGPCGKSTDGCCLYKGDSFGDKWFWAPQVFKRGDKYYIAYCAEEHLAIAESDSPLGPFKQRTLAQIPAPQKQIDPFLFIDDDGKAYMYHVRLISNNSIYVAQMNDDLTEMDQSTAKLCVAPRNNTWENVDNRQWGVTEGPTVVKISGVYYLFYSCNAYTTPYYSVGVATATSPYGPFKQASEPIISTDIVKQNGPGHGDLFKDNDGNWQYVLHTHKSAFAAQPRRTAIVQLDFADGNFKVKDGTFRYLYYQ